MTIKYPFSKEGVKWFEEDTIHDIMNALENDDPNSRKENINDFNIFVTIGNREIVVPIVPETHEDIAEFLNNAIKNYFME